MKKRIDTKVNFWKGCISENIQRVTDDINRMLGKGYEIDKYSVGNDCVSAVFMKYEQELKTNIEGSSEIEDLFTEFRTKAGAITNKLSIHNTYKEFHGNKDKLCISNIEELLTIADKMKNCVKRLDEIGVDRHRPEVIGRGDKIRLDNLAIDIKYCIKNNYQDLKNFMWEHLGISP